MKIQPPSWTLIFIMILLIFLFNLFLAPKPAESQTTITDYSWPGSNEETDWSIFGFRTEPKFQVAEDPENPNLIGRIAFRNHQTNGAPNDQIWRLETPYGSFLFSHTNTPNADCPPPGCPDILEVVETPEGYLVIPLTISVDERDIGFMDVIKYEGF